MALMKNRKFSIHSGATFSLFFVALKKEMSLYSGDTHKSATMEAASPQYIAPPPTYQESSQTPREYVSHQSSPHIQYQQPNYTPYRPLAYPHPYQIHPPHPLQPHQWSSQSAYTPYISTHQEPRGGWQSVHLAGPSSSQSYLPPSQPNTQQQSSKQRPCVIPRKRHTTFKDSSPNQRF